jgi:DNA gyrase/topoisomerase IV subunit B
MEPAPTLEAAPADYVDMLLDSFVPEAAPAPADYVDMLLDSFVPAAAAAPRSAKTATQSVKTATQGAKTAARDAKTVTQGAKIAPAQTTRKAPPMAAKPPAKPRAATRASSGQQTAETPELTAEDSKAAAEKIELSTIKEQAKKHGMWAGALTPCSIANLMGVALVEAPTPVEPASTDTSCAAATTAAGALGLVEIARPHTPALLKIIDEIVVNATDHAKAQERVPRQHVTVIDITYDGERVSVYNDGPGLPVAIHSAATATAGYDVYAPEVSFSRFLSGTNMSKEKDPENIKGGINGLGAKLTNLHSVDFTVETVDWPSRLYYRQQFQDGLDVRNEPTIVNLRTQHGLGPREAVAHTRVSFIPSYGTLGYKPVGRALAPADAADLTAWLRLRAHQAAAYVGSRASVTFNGALCATTSAAALGHLILAQYGEQSSGGLVLAASAKAAEAPYSYYPWDVAIVVLPAGKKTMRRAAHNMLIVNGVVSNKGSHVRYLKKLVSDAVEEKLRKALKRAPAKSVLAKAMKAASAKGIAAPAKGAGAKVSSTAAATAKPKPSNDKKMSTVETLAGVRFVMCGAIPGADWNGQSKEDLQVSPDILARYRLTDTFLKQVGAAVTERILQEQGSASTKVVHEKYTKAEHAGKAARANTYLLAAEGDSAIGLLKDGLTQTRKTGPGGPSLEWCGIISLQGVIVNAAREVTTLETSGGETINVRSEKLRTNKRLMALADALGLRYDRKYETPEELATLAYGKLLICVDQDLDGTGKIAPLVLVWINLFWPALLKAGRIGRFVTPVARAYPKARGAPVEFYYEEELRRWLGEDAGRTAAHNIKYYKGLAAHDEDEVRRMFEPRAFRGAIHTYTVDDITPRLFEVYFGADPGLRKTALVTPVAFLSVEEARALRDRREIPIGRVQLNIDTKAYKNNAIERQIPGAPDGLNPARRKILQGAFVRFRGESAAKELKVFQLGGTCADKMHYHKGEASINGAIVHMAQAFTGARLYPYLVGVGQFGSRHGDKAGSARYIGVKPSPLMRVTFPAADRWHLPYVFEDGERAEPRYFVPVVPMAALESYFIVSEGWNHDSYGRDLDATLAVVLAYIGGDAGLVAAGGRLHAEGATPNVMAEVARLAKLWPLPPSTRGYTGEVRDYRGEAYSFGAYVWDAAARAVTISDLPIGLATVKYLETLLAPGLRGKANPREAFIESIANQSTTDSVSLVVKLREGAYAEIESNFGDEEIDPIEDALMLRCSLRPHLNYFSAAGGVLEFGSCYLAAILYWAPLRRDVYRARFEREKIVTELRIVEEEAIIRYTAYADKMALSSLQDDEAASKILSAAGFPMLHSELLHKPLYATNDELRSLVLSGPGASYDYLLNLRERDLVVQAVTRREKVVAGLRDAHARVLAVLAERPTPGASIWLAELEAFKAVVAEGVRSSWRFKKT